MEIKSLSTVLSYPDEERFLRCIQLELIGYPNDTARETLEGTRAVMLPPRFFCQLLSTP